MNDTIVGPVKKSHLIETDANAITVSIGLSVRLGHLKVGSLISVPQRYLKASEMKQLERLVTAVEAIDIYAGKDLGWFKLLWDEKLRQFRIAEFHLG